MSDITQVIKIGAFMNKALELSKKLQQLDIAGGMDLIEKSNKKALHFDVLGDAMCIMHDDGSVNIIQTLGSGVITSEVISAENILKILRHYRPFDEVFNRTVG
jgi:hypothetical protein